MGSHAETTSPAPLWERISRQKLRFGVTFFEYSKTDKPIAFALVPYNESDWDKGTCFGAIAASST